MFPVLIGSQLLKKVREELDKVTNALLVVKREVKLGVPSQEI